MEEKLFNSTLSALRFGLVRLSPALTVVDKNSTADAIFLFPRRGADVRHLLTEADAQKLLDFGKAKGDCCAVTFTRDNISRNAVAFRENDGGVLLFMHPLLSSLHIYGINNRFSKLVSLYSKNIYEIIHELEIRGTDAVKSISFLPDKSFYQQAAKNHRLVLDAVNAISDKVCHKVLKKTLTISADNKFKNLHRAVIYSDLEYTVGEMLALRELYGERKDAELQMYSCGEYLCIALCDEIDLKSTAGDYIRIVGEILKTVGQGSYAEISLAGDLVFKAFIPYCNELKLRSDEVQMEWELFGYIDYCLIYLNMTK